MLSGKRLAFLRIINSIFRKRSVHLFCTTLILVGVGVLALRSQKLATGSMSKQILESTQYVLSVQTAPQATTAPLVTGMPVRLIISRIKVNASIENVGLTKKGDMATPSRANSVGWLENGSRPGEQGVAVLAGHLDGIQGKPDVFYGLHKMEKGDMFEIVDSNGVASSFVVTDKRTYNPDEKPAEVFTASEGRHVNLVTCAGKWDSANHHFSKRLVVFGEKVL
jgi:sortase A